MSYLIVDLSKLSLKGCKTRIKKQEGKVFLFAKSKKKLKKAKRFSEKHKSIDVIRLPEKKASAAIAKHIRSLLKNNPRAKILVVSPRKKLKKRCKKLQKLYSKACIRIQKKCCLSMKDKLKNDKKADKDQKNQLKQPLFKECETEKASKNLPKVSVELEAEKVLKAVEHVLDDSSAAEIKHAESEQLQDAELAIKKNQPKKKHDLLLYLIQSVNVNEEAAADLIDQLQNTGKITIDVTESVKYL
ncbi:hypothetical protein [Neisseria canis]|uniref:Uncharacterized protein n=1 Tax=Neisseria canis TaxID=493 RepID=A0A448DAF4_9NEIS|nr:hypothetical protein [Neisseria canis]OSI11813.1 hypothetical protein BWD07_08465 [Neisseria canis]VEF03001.1 Uncharacterised protein [Neisseria canis]